MGPVSVRYAGTPADSLEGFASRVEARMDEREERLEAEKAAAAERRKLEEWSAS